MGYCKWCGQVHDSTACPFPVVTNGTLNIYPYPSTQIIQQIRADLIKEIEKDKVHTYYECNYSCIYEGDVCQFKDCCDWQSLKQKYGVE